MQKICQKICHYVDFNIANMQIIGKKYATKYAQYATKYATNMQLICRICISLFAYFAYICTPHLADDAT